eukprot:CAMPEP_0169260838 /NCGR_PEP_ID=MMETSP1016-20121227/42740_1 /TAXON_ID=342587 /ORGANISM="Karlodinium micrum, Strain CCMP2283" /LENGTH=148 /DNA_ID=CAMNT_0009343029 /DNA_START=387 /DNA_END=834 /DNA_ORIENTATION=-
MWRFSHESPGSLGLYRLDPTATALDLFLGQVPGYSPNEPPIAKNLGGDLVPWEQMVTSDSLICLDRPVLDLVLGKPKTAGYTPETRPNRPACIRFDRSANAPDLDPDLVLGMQMMVGFSPGKRPSRPACVRLYRTGVALALDLDVVLG